MIEYHPIAPYTHGCYVTSMSKNENSCIPTSCSENSPLIFRLVMSLCEARKSTTLPFSFLIGTMSNKHQNGEPERKLKVQWINHFAKVLATFFLLSCESIEVIFNSSQMIGHIYRSVQ